MSRFQKFQIKLHRIHHWKGLDLEITDFTYQHDPTPSVENIPSQRPTLKHVEFINISKNPHKIHHWKRFELGITDFNYHDDPTPSAETIPSQSLNP